VHELIGPKGLPLPPKQVEGLRLLGAQLRAARLGRGWSQRRLEWASGVDQTTISRLEYGRLRSLRLTRIGDLMAALRGDWQMFPDETWPRDAKNGIASRRD
jgi:transcriptional regulator with XRE-family HTH domain